MHGPFRWFLSGSTSQNPNPTLSGDFLPFSFVFFFCGLNVLGCTIFAGVVEWTWKSWRTLNEWMNVCFYNFRIYVLNWYFRINPWKLSEWAKWVAVPAMVHRYVRDFEVGISKVGCSICQNCSMSKGGPLTNPNFYNENLKIAWDLLHIQSLRFGNKDILLRPR